MPPTTPAIGNPAAITAAVGLVVSIGALAVCIWYRMKTDPPEVNEADTNPVYGDYYFADTDERIDQMRVEVVDNNMYYE